jgi:hypothetical protein
VLPLYVFKRMHVVHVALGFANTTIVLLGVVPNCCA